MRFKMILKTVEFARKKNLGNFETQDIKLIADFEEGDNIDEVINILKEKVKQHNF